MMANGQAVRRGRYSDELSSRCCANARSQREGRNGTRHQCQRGAHVAQLGAAIVGDSRCCRTAAADVRADDVARTHGGVCNGNAGPSADQARRSSDHVDWPLEAAAQLGIWTRELLK